MHKLRLFLISLSCLLLSTTSMVVLQSARAEARRQHTLSTGQLQAVQAAISILLLEEDEYQVFLPIVVR